MVTSYFDTLETCYHALGIDQNSNKLCEEYSSNVIEWEPAAVIPTVIPTVTHHTNLT